MPQLLASEDQLALKQRELNISRRCAPFMAKIKLMKYPLKPKYLSQGIHSIDLLTCKTELQTKLKISWIQFYVAVDDRSLA